MTTALPDTYERPTISANRLKHIGGKNGCDRKYAGAYLFDMRQSGSDATEFGTNVHHNAEVLQTTGVLPEPESRASIVLSAGAHLLALEGATGRMLIEWEHWGLLPCGTPYTGYLDGMSPDAGATGCVVVQDLKTCSDPKWALNPTTILQDLQAMLYAWITLVPHEHWYCPPLPEGYAGPKHWRLWDPTAVGVRSVRLRWLYFLTRGVPRAWDVSVFVTHAVVTSFYASEIAPLVAKINAAHEWRARNPHGKLDEIDRTPTACGGRGTWCGVYEHNACHMAELGTPLLQLVIGKRNTTMSNENPVEDRMAALRRRHMAVVPQTPEQAPIAEQVISPKAPEAAPAVASPPISAEPAPSAPAPDSSAVAQTSAADASVTGASPRRGRGRPLKQAPTGVNPPESLQDGMTGPVGPTGPLRATGTDACVAEMTTEEICHFLITRGYTVTLTRAA